MGNAAGDANSLVRATVGLWVESSRIAVILEDAVGFGGIIKVFAYLWVSEEVRAILRWSDVVLATMRHKWQADMYVCCMFPIQGIPLPCGVYVRKSWHGTLIAGSKDVIGKFLLLSNSSVYA
jgi:hypothetical protein